MMRRVRKKELFLKTIISKTCYMCDIFKVLKFKKMFYLSSFSDSHNVTIDQVDQSTSSTGIDLSFLFLGAFFLETTSH